MQIQFFLYNNPSEYYQFLTTFQQNETHKNYFFYIDVLRACSTLITMLDLGAKDILVFQTAEQLNEFYSSLVTEQQNKYLRCGEINSLKPDTFDFGNSPFDYIKYAQDKSNKQVLENILFTSSNGAKVFAVFDKLQQSERFLFSFLNYNTVKKYIINEISGNKENKDSVLNFYFVCGGQSSGISIEDSALALSIGADIITQITKENQIWHAEEKVEVHNLMFADNQELTKIFSEINLSKPTTQLFDFIKEKSTHSQYLQSLGYDQDIEYCLQLGNSHQLPKIIEDKVYSNPIFFT